MKKYKVAYVVQASGYDFVDLLEQCNKIEFITTGYEPDRELAKTIQTNLMSYNPSADVLVPVGNVATNMLVGIEAERIRAAKNCKSISVAFYRDHKYVIKTFKIEIK